MLFLARIHVMLKPDVADVQGIAIQQSLARHEQPVTQVKAGKYFEVEVEAVGEKEARGIVEELADGTFSNPTIETYWYDLESRQ